MDNPGQILKRIRRRRQSILSPTNAPRRIPAPTQAVGLSPTVAQTPSGSFPPPSVVAQTPPEGLPPSSVVREPARPIAPRPAGGHALYSELMRSHDRMGTRHLERNG